MDNLSKEKRSWNMSRIKSAGTKPEKLVRSALHKAGYRFRLYGRVSKKYFDKGIFPGKPDIVMAKYRLVIFIHGCFWHCHEGCKNFRIPKTNSNWWMDKLYKNKERDNNIEKKIKEMNWKVLTLWECQIESKKEILVSFLKQKIQEY